MLIIIRDTQSEILTQSVSVKHNDKNIDNVYLFRCYYCGTPISQIKGDVKRIYPEEPDDEQVAVIKQCPKCNYRYTFKTRDYLKNDRIELNLYHDNIRGHISPFHCVICRSLLLAYNTKVIKQLPEETEVALPFSFDCINITCNQRYLLVDVV
jgi:hypothetical protein